MSGIFTGIIYYERFNIVASLKRDARFDWPGTWGTRQWIVGHS
jgi:hypothetical protein